MNVRLGSCKGMMTSAASATSAAAEHLNSCLFLKTRTAGLEGERSWERASALNEQAEAVRRGFKDIISALMCTLRRAYGLMISR